MKYCVVGYKGEIGSHILQGLIKVVPSATNIDCFDKADTKGEQLTRIHRADVIFLCVPFNQTIPWLEEHKKMLKDKWVVEQTSWKTDVYEWAKKNPKVEMRHMHILYKPSITPPEDRRVILFEDTDRWGFMLQSDKFIESGLQAQRYQANIPPFLDIQIPRHDRAMAYQQGDLYKLLENYVKGYKYNVPTTRNFGKIVEIVERIGSFPLELRKSLDRNPYNKRKNK